MIPDENKNPDKNPASITHIHINGSENIIIGSKVTAESVSLGDQSHSTHTHRKNIRVKLFLGLTLSGSLLVIFSIYFKSLTGDAVQAFPVPTSGVKSTAQKTKSPEPSISRPERQNAEAKKPGNPAKQIALNIHTNLEDQMGKKAIHAGLVDGVKEIFSAAGIRYSANPGSAADGYVVNCRVNLAQKPVKIGIRDDLVENRLSLSISSENPSGETCYSKTFFSKPQVDDPTIEEGRALQRCLDDLSKQINVTTLANCLY